MVMSKLWDISDTAVYINGHILPGVTFINESIKPVYHNIRAFGESKPTDVIEQGRQYTLKLKKLYSRDYPEFKETKNFSLTLYCGKTVISSYSNCNFTEINLTSDNSGKLYIEAYITSDNKV